MKYSLCGGGSKKCVRLCVFLSRKGWQGRNPLPELQEKGTGYKCVIIVIAVATDFLIYFSVIRAVAAVVIEIAADAVAIPAAIPAADAVAKITTIAAV